MIRRRILKIGGSLLSNPRLTAAVDDWLTIQPPAQNLVIVGGGQAIEAMRELSQRFELDESAMHWRCIRLLRATYEVAGELFRHWQPVGDPGSLDLLTAEPRRSGHWLIAVDTFYSPETAEAAGLPIGWGTTTDAIAAYLARLSEADEMVLLKSCPIPADASLEQLTSAGIVDAALAAALPRDLCLRVEQLETGAPSPSPREGRALRPGEGNPPGGARSVSSVETASFSGVIERGGRPRSEDRAGPPRP